VRTGHRRVADGTLWRLFFGEVEAYDRMEHVRERTGNQHPSTAPRNIYETADGHITMSASNQKIFERVAEAIDKPELVDDPRFEDNFGPRREQRTASTRRSNRGRNSARPPRRPRRRAHDAIVGPALRHGGYLRGRAVPGPR